MASNRIKGQEVSIEIVADNQIVSSMTAVRSCEFKYNREILSEGYIGEKTERKDSIFKGVSGSMEVHLDDPNAFNFFIQMNDKSKRRLPGVTVNVKMTLNFPDGRRVRIIVPDVEFGELPVNFGSRSDYGTTSLDFEASDARAIIG